MSVIVKKIVAPFMLAAFLVVAFFGFTAMSYGSNGKMEGGCPFSATGAALCPQDASAVLHHIGAYSSFLSIPVDSAALALVGALLLAACLLVLFIRPPLFRLVPIGNHFNTDPPVSARTRKITRWLSLLENSPSLI